MKGPVFSFCTGSHKFYRWFCSKAPVIEEQEEKKASLPGSACLGFAHWAPLGGGTGKTGESRVSGGGRISNGCTRQTDSHTQDLRGNRELLTPFLRNGQWAHLHLCSGHSTCAVEVSGRERREFTLAPLMPLPSNDPAFRS